MGPFWPEPRTGQTQASGRRSLEAILILGVPLVRPHMAQPDPLCKAPNRLISGLFTTAGGPPGVIPAFSARFTCNNRVPGARIAAGAFTFCCACSTALPLRGHFVDGSR